MSTAMPLCRRRVLVIVLCYYLSQGTVTDGVGLAGNSFKTL